MIRLYAYVGTFVSIGALCISTSSRSRVLLVYAHTLGPSRVKYTYYTVSTEAVPELCEQRRQSCSAAIHSTSTQY